MPDLTFDEKQKLAELCGIDWFETYKEFMDSSNEKPCLYQEKYYPAAAAAFDWGLNERTAAVCMNHLESCTSLYFDAENAWYLNYPESLGWTDTPMYPTWYEAVIRGLLAREEK